MSKTIARHASIPTSTPRARRLAQIAGGTVIAGLVAGGLALTAAPANAATTAPTGNLPNCVLPSGVSWQLKHVVIRPFLNQRIILNSTWTASGDGHTYNGSVRYAAIAPNVAVADGDGAYVNCTVS